MSLRIFYPGMDLNRSSYKTRTNLMMLKYYDFEIEENIYDLQKMWLIPKSINIGNNTLQYLFEKGTNNWLDSDNMKTKNVKSGDLMLVLPNTNIPHEGILNNLGNLNLKNIFQTKSEFYFEIPELRHLLKYILLKIKPNIIKSKMMQRQVDFAIYEII